MACYRLRNPVQRYAWGSRTVIPELLGADVPSAEPWAELWMGAHARAPSEAEVGGTWRSLRAWVEDRPAQVLGAAVAERFGAQLPFLFKVLAVERPLSLQTHPDAARAALGFAREESEGVPADAPQRHYPDANPKPELVVALGPFEALCSFRSPHEVRENARRLGAARFDRLLALAPRGAPSGEILARLLRLPRAERRELAAELAARAAARGPQGPALAWLVRLAHDYPGDVACAAPLLLHHVRLAAGEALALQPGELHCYLRGSALEIMASSDNVLRAGLTPKHIDAAELLRVLQPQARAPARVAAQPGAPGEEVYDAGSEWFRLALLRPRADAPLALDVAHGAEILLCLEGRGEIAPSDAPSALPFARGEAVFVTGDTPRYALRGDATAARATSGLPLPCARRQEES